MLKVKDTRRPAYWEPDEKWVVTHKESIRAIKAVYDGTANEGQQRMAMTIILDEFCNRMGNQYHTNERDTAFALGKKFVADLIVGAINTKLGQIKEP